MTHRKYWLALVDFVPRAATRAPDDPAGGIVWVVGAGATKTDFMRLVTDAPEFEDYKIAEWMELDELEPGFTSEALDGDAIVADLARTQKRLFIDEVQWYAEEGDGEE